jgi:hypothetical protein
MMVGVGTLMTLDLPDGAPALSMPWIITFGPLDDDEDWEPVVVGPYEREHALALAEEIVADEDLMAVVEPLLPHTSVQDIRAEIDAAILAGESVDDEDEEDDEEALDDGDDDDEAGYEDDGDDEPDEDEEEDEDEDEELLDDAEDEVATTEVTSVPDRRPGGPPSPDEIRAGFARIAARLTAQP